MSSASVCGLSCVSPSGNDHHRAGVHRSAECVQHGGPLLRTRRRGSSRVLEGDCQPPLRAAGYKNRIHWIKTKKCMHPTSFVSPLLEKLPSSGATAPTAPCSATTWTGWSASWTVWRLRQVSRRPFRQEFIRIFSKKLFSVVP